MAYINIIISSHLDVFQSLFLSRYTLILPFFPLLLCLSSGLASFADEMGRAVRC